MNRFDHDHEPDGRVATLGPLTSARPDLSGPGRPKIPASHVARTGLQSFPGRVADTLSTWDRRLRYRRELKRLDDHLLADIGITPGQARAEAEKPFWRA